ncbi:MAG TPA: TNT domain-containing protein [Actinocatenispora sp.]
MRTRRLLAAAAVATALAAAPLAPATAHPTHGAGCRPGTPASAPPTQRYLDDHEYLGPEPLPHRRPVGPLLHGYRRLGGLAETTFTARYRDGDRWVYPPADGFLVRDGRPVKHREEMVPGERIDRFGYAGGAYLAPTGTPFAQRALPPQNLNTPADTPQSNYHEYCVAKTFDVDAGPIAPWFGQPGRGRQFKLDPGYLPAAGTALSVTWLLAHGYLVEEDPTAWTGTR